MFRNYIKVGLRNLSKYKVFSFINIFGLATSMCVCLLIISMVAELKQYDQFHVKKDRTYRITSWTKGNFTGYATSPYMLSSTLKDDYPVVENATRMMQGVGGDITFDQKTLSCRGFFADNEYFSVFDFEFEKGNPGNALAQPNSIVLSHDLAKRLFGDSDPLGKTVDFSDRGLPHIEFSGLDNPAVPWGTFEITGVMSNSDYKSHMKWELLMSAATIDALVKEGKLDEWTYNWENYYNTYTYVVIPEKRSESNLQSALDEIGHRQYSEKENFENFELKIQPLTKISPGRLLSNFTSYRMPIEGIYFLSFLAFIIMLMACLNYTNLSVARALTRAQEVGIRKVTGATRKNLIYQFMSESIVTSLFSLALAIVLLVFLKPAFMGLWINKFLNFELQENIPVYLIFVAFAILVGIIAGLYPSIYLSKYRPIIVLKKIDQRKAGRLGMKKLMTVSQFAVSFFFIVTTLLVYKQLKHFLNFEYGFSTENIINVELQSNEYELISNEFAKIPGVSRISACEYIPATGISNGIDIKKEGSEEDFVNMTRISVDENFISNLGIELLYGRNLPDLNESKEGLFLLINETAVTKLGYENPAQVIGEFVEIRHSDQSAEIIGIFKDFRFRLPMFSQDIGPLVLRTRSEDFSYMNIKVGAGDLVGILDRMEEKWKELDPVHDFKYDIFDKQLAGTHQVLGDVVSIVGFIGFFTIVIACLGLLGMATYSVERRIKEVGIRKVFGAGEGQITYLLSKGFIKLLIISMIISIPLTYLANNLWLQNFPNRVSLGPELFLTGSLIVLVLGLMVIGTQTLKASRANPVNTIRYE